MYEYRSMASAGKHGCSQLVSLHSRCPSSRLAGLSVLNPVLLCRLSRFFSQFLITAKVSQRILLCGEAISQATNKITKGEKDLQMEMSPNWSHHAPAAPFLWLQLQRGCVGGVGHDPHAGPVAPEDALHGSAHGTVHPPALGKLHASSMPCPLMASGMLTHRSDTVGRRHVYSLSGLTFLENVRLGKDQRVGWGRTSGVTWWELGPAGACAAEGWPGSHGAIGSW